MRPDGRVLKAICLLLLAFATTGCSSLFFYPLKIHVRTPSEMGLTYEEVEFRSGDNTKLHGWWLPARGSPKGTILYLHGNAENISTHIANVAWLPEQGYNIFMFDYRGYGKSAGEIDLSGAIQDAEAAITTTLARPETNQQAIIVFGQSLGGSIAIHAVAHSPQRNRIKSLIVESSFSSYRQIAREKFGSLWLTWPLQYPLAWSISDRYSPLKSIAQISPIPLLLVYGDGDRIVPPHHGEQLLDAAREPKELWRIPGGQHITAFREAEQRQRLLAYLDALR